MSSSLGQDAAEDGRGDLPLQDWPELEPVFRRIREDKKNAYLAEALGQRTLNDIIADLDSLQFIKCQVRHEDTATMISPTTCKNRANNAGCTHFFDSFRDDSNSPAIKLRRGMDLLRILAFAQHRSREMREIRGQIYAKLAPLLRHNVIADALGQDAHNPDPSTMLQPTLGLLQRDSLAETRDAQAHSAELILGARDVVKALITDLVSATNTAEPLLQHFLAIDDQALTSHPTIEERRIDYRIDDPYKHRGYGQIPPDHFFWETKTGRIKRILPDASDAQ